MMVDTFFSVYHHFTISLLFAAVLFLCLLVVCGCGNDDVPQEASGETVFETPRGDAFCFAPGYHRDYVHFVTLADEPMIKVFSSYNELESFIDEGGLLRHVSTSSTHSLENLLNFFSAESFEENVVVLFIPKTGDMRYKGSLTQIKGDAGRLEAVIEYDLDSILDNDEEKYALSIAFKIPKEYCNKDTAFDFVFGERETQILPETGDDTSSPETEKAEAETEAAAVQKLPLGEKVTRLEDLESLDTVDSKIEMVKAFLTKDAEKMDALCYYSNVVYDGLNNVQISGFEAWCEKSSGSVENDLFLNITVSQADPHSSTLTAGQHTLKFANHRNCLEVVGRKEGTDITPDTETEKFMSSWMKYMGYKFGVEYNTGYTQNYVEFVHSFYKELYGEGGTKAVYEKYYKAIFGVGVTRELENYLTFEDGGKAEIKYGHGLNGYWFDFVESGKDYAVIQFYADHGYLVYGPKIKYTFTRSDGILVPLDSNCLNDNPKEPASYSA